MKRGIDISAQNAPLYDALLRYYRKGTVPFHMPGHKLGRGLPEEFLNSPAFLDVTEIPGMDNLHRPAGVIKHAQELAAEAFGSKRTYFLVNGSTCGIYAMTAAVCRPGDSLIVARDCHRSVINGLMLAGVRPVYIMPMYDEQFGITTAISPDTVEKCLLDNPDAAGVLITRPSYYGICCDIKKIARIVHSHNKILAVDEAHGSHFRFGASFPICAMDAGADICVQSAHKTLPALTQGAYLHVGSDTIDREKLEYYLSLYQTSSPSYIIMASLDIARDIMQREGPGLLKDVADSIGECRDSFRAALTNNDAVFKNGLFTFVDSVSITGFDTDPARIVVNTGNSGLPGYEAEAVLRLEYNLQVEMSDLFNIVCIATIADTAESISYLFRSLERLGASCAAAGPVIPGALKQFFFMPLKQLDFQEAMRSRWERVPIGKAAGRVSKGIIAPYPPGIPVVCPGETISSAVVEHIVRILEYGGNVSGLEDDMTVGVIV